MFCADYLAIRAGQVCRLNSFFVGQIPDVIHALFVFIRLQYFLINSAWLVVERHILVGKGHI